MIARSSFGSAGARMPAASNTARSSSWTGSRSARYHGQRDSLPVRSILKAIPAPPARGRRTRYAAAPNTSTTTDVVSTPVLEHNFHGPAEIAEAEGRSPVRSLSPALLSLPVLGGRRLPRIVDRERRPTRCPLRARGQAAPRRARGRPGAAGASAIAAAAGEASDCRMRSRDCDVSGALSADRAAWALKRLSSVASARRTCSTANRSVPTATIDRCAPDASMRRWYVASSRRRASASGTAGPEVSTVRGWLRERRHARPLILRADAYLVGAVDFTHRSDRRQPASVLAPGHPARVQTSGVEASGRPRFETTYGSRQG